MSKKKRSAVQKQNVKRNNRAENLADSTAENSSTKGWWKSLSRQGRWAAVGVIVFLAVGVFGVFCPTPRNGSIRSHFLKLHGSFA